MIWWYLTDLARHRSERGDLAALPLEVDWFTPIKWRVDDSRRLILDFEIAAGGKWHKLFLRYPESFPHSPPSILPMDPKDVLSGHQYGAGGELCLEYRADNWTSDLTGADMIRSAQRLLSGETPVPGERAVVASAHRTSLGQQLRGSFSRLLLTNAVRTALNNIPADVNVRGSSFLQFHDAALVYGIRKIVLPDGIPWTDVTTPSGLAFEVYESSTSIMRIGEAATLPSTVSLAEFDAEVALLGCDATADIVVLLRENDVIAFRRFSSTASVTQLKVIEPETVVARLSPEYSSLAGKRVVIVGCGSLGSKIATILARSGVGHFLLLDDDVLLPDNLVRGDLDWREVGLHKVEAVGQKLRLVRPGTSVVTQRIQLGGQESGASAESALTAIAACDLVVDATASAVAQNVLAGILKSAQKPIVWAEVFAGGIGGLIARCRPGTEPPVPMMRRAIENWFSDRNTPPIRAAAGYGDDSGPTIMIADDADVTAIAAPAARLAIDCLLERNPSFFPKSVYVLGLSPSPVFEQPFETHPIDLPDFPEEDAPPTLEATEIQAEIEVIIDLFKKKSDEDTGSQ